MRKKSERKTDILLEQHLPTEGRGRDEMILFYSWTFEDAWKAQEKWNSDNKQRGPFPRWIGVQELKELHKQHQAGNIKAIIEAIYVCSLNSLPLPRWCQMAFLSAYRDVRQYRKKCWDDVFGRPHPKGTHLEAKKAERDKSIAVYLRIRNNKITDPTFAINYEMFEGVGKEFGISRTLAEEYYYKWKRIVEVK